MVPFKEGGTTIGKDRHHLVRQFQPDEVSRRAIRVSLTTVGFRNTIHHRLGALHMRQLTRKPLSTPTWVNSTTSRASQGFGTLKDFSLSRPASPETPPSAEG